MPTRRRKVDRDGASEGIAAMGAVAASVRRAFPQPQDALASEIAALLEALGAFRGASFVIEAHVSFD